MSPNQDSGAQLPLQSNICPGGHSPGITSQSPASNSNSSHHKLTGTKLPSSS